MTRRWISLLGLVFATTLVGAPSARADIRIGVVDLGRVLDSFARYKTRAEALENRKKQLQEIVDRQEEEVVRLLDELDQLGATGGDEAARRRSDIEDRDRVLRDFVGRTNRKFREELAALQARTKDEIETAVSRVAESSELSFVIEKNLVLFTAPSLDVTERVVTRINLLFPIENSAPPPLGDVQIPDFPPPSSGSSPPRGAAPPSGRESSRPER